MTDAIPAILLFLNQHHGDRIVSVSHEVRVGNRVARLDVGLAVSDSELPAPVVDSVPPEEPA